MPKYSNPLHFHRCISFNLSEKQHVIFPHAARTQHPRSQHESRKKKKHTRHPNHHRKDIHTSNRRLTSSQPLPRTRQIQLYYIHKKYELLIQRAHILSISRPLLYDIISGILCTLPHLTKYARIFKPTQQAC
ncbi:uncharacterized protein LOC111629630 [Centruroides sculpturatus]|uniref:uncharacterized protein LOC111629630 n=1 Tax=Centruroides sculpturatus TaxID=218467 RepID=UPI000C6D6982|nr:uncharacterized protein LOC111629630 [Centruroides sculpturatus]